MLNMKRIVGEDSMPLGLLIIVVVQFIAGFGQIVAGLWRTFHGDVLGYLFFGVGVAIFASGVGLTLVRRWAWYLAIILDVVWMVGRFAVGLIVMASTLRVTTIGIPLEPLVIAYLIWKRRLFAERLPFPLQGEIANES